MSTEAEPKMDTPAKDQPVKKRASKNASVEPEQSSNGHVEEAPPQKPLDSIPEEATGNEVKVTNGSQNGKKATNGDSAHNGNSEHVIEIVDDDSETPASEHDNDDLFPELNYDEEDDPEGMWVVESPTYSPVGRSMTRRSQAQKIPTPETPQPKQAEDPSSSSSRPPSRSTPQPDHPMVLREKVLRLREGQATPRRDSISSDASSSSRKNKDDQSTKDDKEEEDDLKNGAENTTEEVHTKTDTNFSKSRIKVSPYRRSMRLSEQYSTIANYSGSNSTQNTEIIGDISSSSRDRSPAPDSDGEASNSEKGINYLESVRNIKGRRSYRPLREVTLRHLSAQRYKQNKPESEKEADEVSISSVNATIGSEVENAETSSNKWTPIGHVVGRKRRQEDDIVSSPALILSAGPTTAATQAEQPPSKRMRLLGHLATPFRHIRDRVTSTPIFSRHAMGRTSFKVDPLINTETVPDPKSEEPMVADIVHPKTAEEQKWCSIM